MDDSTVSNSRLRGIYAWLKYLLCITNFVILVCGSVLLGLGIWIKYGSESFVNILGGYSAHFLDLVFLCIIVGCIMCLLGCLGFYGAYKENRFLLWLFLLFMLLFTMVAIVAIVLILTFSKSLEIFLKEQGLTSLKEIYYVHGNTGVVTESWNAVMSKLHCCGAFNYRDFESSTFSNKTGLKYPKRCCRDPYLVQCDGTNVTKQIIYMQGCFSVILEKVKNNSRWLGTAAICLTLMALASLFIVLMLSIKLGD